MQQFAFITVASLMYCNLLNIHGYIPLLTYYIQLHVVNIFGGFMYVHLKGVIFTKIFLLPISILCTLFVRSAVP